jgi:hypothetical protein
LWAKKFIKDIIYSPSDIQINLYYSRDIGVFKNPVLPYGVGMGRDKKRKGSFRFSFQKPPVRNIKTGSALQIFTNCANNFTEYHSPIKNEKSKKMIAPPTG